MNLRISTAVKTITAATIASVFVIVLGVVQAEAAPGGGYFITDTSNEAMSFESWAGANTPQACGAYDAVFYDGQCVKPGGNGGGAVLGIQDEAQVKVTLNETRCVNEDGVAELTLEDVELFELKNTSTGDIVKKGGTNANFQTNSDLTDGNYRYTGRGDGGSDKVTFTIDCDPKKPEKDSVSVSCDVTPDNPKIGEEVSWKADADGGGGDYSYNWSGAVFGDDATETATYDTAGKKTGYIKVRSDGKSDTARCNVSVTDGDDDGDNGGGGDKNDGHDDGDEDDDTEDPDSDDDVPTFSRTIEEF